jgi:M6 family metalloprotease-like protein
MNAKTPFVVFVLAASVAVPSPVFAAVKAGAPCAKVGKVQNSGNFKFTCLKSGKKSTWSKGVAIEKPVPMPSESRDPVPMPSESRDPVPMPSESRETASKFQLTTSDSFANLNTCRIKSSLSNLSETVGFPRSKTGIPSIGKVKGVTLFVEFTDLKDDGNPIRAWKTQQVPTAMKYYEIASYGKYDFKVELVEKVFLINKSVLSYNLDTHHDAPAKPNANPFGLVLDAMNAADPEVDFSQYDYVNVVTPSTTLIGFEGAVGMNSIYDGKLFQRATFGPIREYVDSPRKYNWLVHESGHLLGLMHPYNTSGAGFYSGYVIPTWDLMGASLTENSEFLSWNKFLLGWLDSSQVNCLDGGVKSNSTHLIAPLTENAVGVKATIVKLSDTQALVLENRRKSALNDLKRDQEGVVAYVVDGAIENGKGAVSFLYEKLTVTYETRLIGTLKPGESIRHKNILVKVLSSAIAGDYVSVSIE